MLILTKGRNWPLSFLIGRTGTGIVKVDTSGDDAMLLHKKKGFT